MKENRFYAMSTDELFKKFRTSADGLSSKEAEKQSELCAQCIGYDDTGIRPVVSIPLSEIQIDEDHVLIK